MIRVALGDGLSVYRFETLGKVSGVSHFVSTRAGGCSPVPYATLNLAFHTGDAPPNVRRNRARLLGALGVSPARVVVGQQVHRARIHAVVAADAGRGAEDAGAAIAGCDGLVTDAADLCLLVLVADCVPVVVADERARAVGVAHAGWRGAVAGIAERLVAAVCATSGGRPGELWAGIGPSIGPAHYEVGPAVAAAVRAAEPDTWPDLLVPSAAGRVRLDLWQLNALQLRRAGVPADRIEVAGCSTFDADQPYFSHRRDGHPTGRFAAGVMLH